MRDGLGGSKSYRIIIVYSRGWIYGFGNGIDNRVAMEMALIPPREMGQCAPPSRSLKSRGIIALINQLAIRNITVMTHLPILRPCHAIRNQ